MKKKPKTKNIVEGNDERLCIYIKKKPYESTELILQIVHGEVLLILMLWIVFSILFL